jgi:hypothetical protein
LTQASWPLITPSPAYAAPPPPLCRCSSNQSRARAETIFELAGFLEQVACAGDYLEAWHAAARQRQDDHIVAAAVLHQMGG